MPGSGTSSQSSNTNSTSQSQGNQNLTSTTNPWDQSVPLMGGILKLLGDQGANYNTTPTQTGAINTIEGNAGNFNFTPQIANGVSTLLSGGNAMSYSPMVNDAYRTFVNQTNPLASNTNYNPYSTPGFSDAVSTLTSDITNNANSQFAAAGRDGSPANSQAVARGIAQGIAPVIASQYNQNVANQQGAAGNLYSAGNTTANTLTGYNQQGNNNTLAGISAIPGAVTAANSGPNSILEAEAQRYGIPVNNLGMLAQIGVPIAQLGRSTTSTGSTSSNSTGNSTTNQQNTPSLLQQIQGWTGVGSNLAAALFGV